MTAETLTRSPLIIAASGGLGGTVKRQYFAYVIGAAVEADDVFRLGWIPKNCLVVGGNIATTDIDTGTETLDVDVGWEANGGGSATWTDPNTGLTFTNAGSTLDADGFADVGVMTGDGIAQVYQAGVNYREIVLPVPLFFSERTMVTLTAVAPSHGGHTGTYGVYLDYLMT